MRRFLLVVAAVLALAVGACGDDTGSSSTADGSVPAGFTTAEVQIRRADGSVCELCTYLADDPEERSEGLMQVTDLDGHDGMLFVYQEPAPRSFWMKNTVMPLSAAWFGPDGTLLAAVDMEPCPPEVDDCPTYGPSAAATHVLEVPSGDLDVLGIGPGSRLESVGPPCRPDR